MINKDKDNIHNKKSFGHIFLVVVLGVILGFSILGYFGYISYKYELKLEGCNESNIYFANAFTEFGNASYDAMDNQEILFLASNYISFFKSYKNHLSECEEFYTQTQISEKTIATEKLANAFRITLAEIKEKDIKNSAMASELIKIYEDFDG